jgi:hypothetical protein
MTYGEFKQACDNAGLKDEDLIWFIDCHPQAGQVALAATPHDVHGYGLTDPAVVPPGEEAKAEAVAVGEPAAQEPAPVDYDFSLPTGEAYDFTPGAAEEPVVAPVDESTTGPTTEAPARRSHHRK